jgi:hypothetical protein
MPARAKVVSKRTVDSVGRRVISRDFPKKELRILVIRCTIMASAAPLVAGA